MRTRLCATHLFIVAFLSYYVAFLRDFLLRVVLRFFDELSNSTLENRHVPIFEPTGSVVQSLILDIRSFRVCGLKTLDHSTLAILQEFIGTLEHTHTREHTFSHILI